MANDKFAEMVDPRLLEAAWHRYETARALAQAVHGSQNAREVYNRAASVHAQAVTDYDNLERDIARGVRMGAGRAA